MGHDPSPVFDHRPVGLAATAAIIVAARAGGCAAEPPQPPKEVHE